ncbi:MAG: hypothetical protein K2H60_16130 [Muribaculaceae bacterium]|nr:hypothetical protein [Muribaculaceae bacterium]
MNNRLRNFLLGIGVSLFSLSASASTLTDAEAENAMATESKVEKTEERESLFPNATRNLDTSHFTWGAEFGASIDLSGYNTSTFNVDAVLGYKNNYFRILGAGVGIHRSLGTGDNFIPVYGLMRTSFSSRPRLFFLSLKVGYSFNTIGDSPTFGDTNSQIGWGINLAMSRKFQSHIILAYEFRHFNARHKHVLDDKANDISLATISFGVNF